MVGIQERLKKINLWEIRYDLYVRHCVFQPGEQVLVFLPTSIQKLLAEWQGLYTQQHDKLVKRVMMDRQKQKWVFHDIMLCKWHPPTAVSFLVEGVGDDADDMATWGEGDDGMPQLAQPAQIQDVENILQE